MRDASSHSNYVSHIPTSSPTPSSSSSSSSSSGVRRPSLESPSLLTSILSAMTFGAISVPARVVDDLKDVYTSQEHTSSSAAASSINDGYTATGGVRSSIPPSKKKRRAKRLLGQVASDDPLVLAEDDLFHNKVVSVLVMVGVVMLILMGGTAIVALEVPTSTTSTTSATSVTPGSITNAASTTIRSSQSTPSLHQAHDDALMHAVHAQAISQSPIVVDHIPTAVIAKQERKRQQEAKHLQQSSDPKHKAIVHGRLAKLAATAAAPSPKNVVERRAVLMKSSPVTPTTTKSLPPSPPPSPSSSPPVAIDAAWDVNAEIVREQSQEQRRRRRAMERLRKHAIAHHED